MSVAEEKHQLRPRAGAVRAVVGDALLTIQVCPVSRQPAASFRSLLPQSWSALNITNLTWSFAKLAVRHQELFSAVETWPQMGERS